MKKFFVVTNAFNCVVISDEKGYSLPLNEQNGIDCSSLETVQSTDFSFLNDYKSVKKLAYEINEPNSVMIFDSNTQEECCKVIEF